MATGIIVATAKYYSGVLDNGADWGNTYNDIWFIISCILASLLLLTSIALTILRAIRGQSRLEKLEMPLSWVFGMIFGLGLTISGMCRRTKIVNFLTIYSGWDPSLMFVMVGGLLVTFITFPLII